MNKSPSRIAVFLTIEKQEKNIEAPSELIFHKYGDKIFLSEIVERGEMDGAEVVKSKMEKRVERTAQGKEVAIAIGLE